MKKTYYYLKKTKDEIAFIRSSFMIDNEWINQGFFRIGAWEYYTTLVVNNFLHLCVSLGLKR